MSVFDQPTPTSVFEQANSNEPAPNASLEDLNDMVANFLQKEDNLPERFEDCLGETQRTAWIKRDREQTLKRLGIEPEQKEDWYENYYRTTPKVAERTESGELKVTGKATTARQQMELMAEIRKDVYAKYGITS